MENIRNFVIVAHIDHGKSTLGDRFLELTKAVPKEKMKPQFLDTMDLEREKGVTIKMQPMKMGYVFKNKPYILNLIDTPGHIDFNYEVSRSLAAVEGAILLVDATKGVQAQTIHNLELAQKQGLKIIPAINKIDLSQAEVKEAKEELSQLLKTSEEKIFLISAKEGTNVESLLQAVIEKIPCPQGEKEKPLKALIFDSKYDSFKGVISYVRVFDGEVKKGEEIRLIVAEKETRIKEVGVFQPFLKEKENLEAGEIGYIATGIKEPGSVRVGDTITNLKTFALSSQIKVKPLPGYKEPKPMVFASFYPEMADDFDLLKKALSQLKLNDAALTFEPERREMLGRGFRCGFLGTFHAEITSERLRREFDLKLIISRPQVIYKIIDAKEEEQFIYSVTDWLEPQEIKEIQEPWVKLEVITPSKFLGQALELLEQSEGNQIEIKYLPSGRLLLIYEIPLREIIVDFYNKLKGISQGFASMNYELLGYRKEDLVKLDILIGGVKEEVFSRIVPRKKAFEEGKEIVSKLKEILPAQLFSLPLQATIGGKVIARETLRSRGKDVIAPLYGGDYTRKRKLLEKQKKGKKKLKEEGKVKIPSEVFLEMFKGL